MLVLATCISHGVAEEPASDGQETFREFGEFMVRGVWVRTDDDGNELEHDYRWAAHKQCVVMRTVSDPNAGAGFIYVDPRTGKCVWRGFNHGPKRGAVAAEVVVERVAENQWGAKGESVGSGGVMAGEWTLTGKGDELRVQGQPTLNGEKQDPVDVTWRRRKMTATKEEFAEFLRAMTGRWTGETTLAEDTPGIGKKGDRMQVQGENSLSAKGDALVWKATDQRGGSVASLAYYDAETQQIREQVVFGGGVIVSSTFVKDNDRWLSASHHHQSRRRRIPIHGGVGHYR